jgi:hypothetical protein
MQTHLHPPCVKGLFCKMTSHLQEEQHIYFLVCMTPLQRMVASFEQQSDFISGV